MSGPLPVQLQGPGTLPVAEVFGPTFQGEGRSLGVLASFVRLGGCNLTCRACDTAFTWDARRYDLRAELTPRTPAEIVAMLPAAPLTVVTGGEPLLYQHRPPLVDLLHAIWRRSSRVEIETNGTIVPTGNVIDQPHVRFNVSPKLDGPMSDDPAERRIVPVALDAFAGLAAIDRAVFKFVVDGVPAVDQAAALVTEHRIDPTTVWIMPEGNDPDRILATARSVADAVLAYGFNLTTRLHVLLWPKTDRGR